MWGPRLPTQSCEDEGCCSRAAGGDGDDGRERARGGAAGGGGDRGDRPPRRRAGGAGEAGGGGGAAGAGEGPQGEEEAGPGAWPPAAESLGGRVRPGPAPAEPPERGLTGRTAPWIQLDFGGNERSGLGYLEEDSAGQTNIFAVEPKVYVGGNVSGAWPLALLFSLLAGGGIFYGLKTLQEDEATVQYTGNGQTLSAYVTKFTPKKVVVVPPPAPAPAPEAAPVAAEE